VSVPNQEWHHMILKLVQGALSKSLHIWRAAPDQGGTHNHTHHNSPPLVRHPSAQG